jgi:hypothetical protein
MGRPRKIARNVEVKITIPEELYGRVQLELFSPLKGRIPYGVFSGEVVKLLEGWLSTRTGEPINSNQA